jgi:hypothetical protein
VSVFSQSIVACVSDTLTIVVLPDPTSFKRTKYSTAPLTDDHCKVTDVVGTMLPLAGATSAGAGKITPPEPVVKDHTSE